MRDKQQLNLEKNYYLISETKHMLWYVFVFLTFQFPLDSKMSPYFQLNSLVLTDSLIDLSLSIDSCQFFFKQYNWYKKNQVIRQTTGNISDYNGIGVRLKSKRMLALIFYK